MNDLSVSRSMPGTSSSYAAAQARLRADRPRSNSDSGVDKSRSVDKKTSANPNIYPLDNQTMHGLVAVLHPVPAVWPKPYWKEDRLQAHWNGKKRGTGKATPHKNEFLVLGVPPVRSAKAYAAFSMAFMSPYRPKGGPIIERMSHDNKHILRYDYEKICIAAWIR